MVCMTIPSMKSSAASATFWMPEGTSRFLRPASQKKPKVRITART